MRLNHLVYFQLKKTIQLKQSYCLFAYDKNKFKVIGPFVADNYVLSVETFETLFKTMTSNQPDDAVFNFSLKKAFNNTNH